MVLISWIAKPKTGQNRAKKSETIETAENWTRKAEIAGRTETADSNRGGVAISNIHQGKRRNSGVHWRLIIILHLSK